jgi:hypothetical protein
MALRLPAILSTRASGEMMDGGFGLPMDLIALVLTILTSEPTLKKF